MRNLTRYLCGSLLTAPLFVAAALAQTGPLAGRGPGLPDSVLQRDQPATTMPPGTPGQIVRPALPDQANRPARPELRGNMHASSDVRLPDTARLASDTRLSTALTTSFSRRGVAVPEGGLGTACAGFGNLGECIAALNAAHNLSLEGGFPALKAVMTTGNRLQLGRAIKALKPNADVTAAERQARRDARRDLDEAGRSAR